MPPGPPARRASSSSGRHQGLRPTHTRLLPVEGIEDRVEAVVDRVYLDVEYRSPGLAVEATIISTASSNSNTPVRRQFWSRGAIRRRYQRRRVAPRGIAALARRLGAPLRTVRAKGPRGQDLQGTVEIRRDLRHLWPVRPSDALLHSKPTCPACSRRCRPCSPPPPLLLPSSPLPRLVAAAIMALMAMQRRWPLQRWSLRSRRTQ